jgi:23S rRNA pseudoU1915 N3-methylase RlmH
MCYVAAIPYIIAAVGTAASVAETVHANNQAAQYQQDVADQNVKLDKQQANNALAEGSYQADQARIRGQLQKGAQVAALAANNVDITTGSAADILGDTAMFTEQDKRQAQINGAAKAYGYDIDALNQQGNGQFAQWQADTNNTAAMIKGASSIAGSAYGAYGAGAGGTPATTGTTLLNGSSYNGPNSLSTSWAGNNKQISWLGR